MHNSKLAVSFLVLNVLAVCLGATLTFAQTASQPNILFILTEDAGAYDGVIGTPGVQTPGLASIANRGIYFSNAHVAAPVCSVSKAALMTGMMPHSNNLRTNVQNFYPGTPGIAPGDIGPNDANRASRINAILNADQNSSLNSRFRVEDDIPTLIEVLNNAGYYTGVTHKQHVTGLDRFMYDHWVDNQNPDALNKVAAGAAAANEPFFLLFNTPEPHRPYINSDTTPISVDPNEVVVPGQFVDTPVSRQDWAEHLNGVELADAKVVDLLTRLDNLGLTANTIVVFMSDHGPSWHRGKQSTYALGSAVSLAFAGPGVVLGGINDTVVNEIDLMPTLLEMIGLTSQPVQGKSIASILNGTAPASTAPRYSFTEVQHSVRTTDDGQNEKKVTDGEYSLIWRANHTLNREFNADQHVSGNPWRNRIYDETISVYSGLQANPGNSSPLETDRINRAYRFLDEMDTNPSRNNNLFVNQELEMFHNTVDPDELYNIVDDPTHAATRDRLLSALYSHLIKTNDTYVDARLIPAAGVTGDHFEGRVAGSNLGADATWTTQQLGNSSVDFTFNPIGPANEVSTIDAPGGSRVLATFDGAALDEGESFHAAVDVNFKSVGVGAGLVFGFAGMDNFFEFQLLDGNTSVGGANKDIRLRQIVDGVESDFIFVNNLENIDRDEAYRLAVDYNALDSTAELMVVNEHGIPYFSQTFTFDAPIPPDTLFGISTWANNNAEFSRFDLQATAAVPSIPLLGDCNQDGVVNFLDISPFIAILSSGNLLDEADCNQDGVVNFLDISPFITILSGS